MALTDWEFDTLSSVTLDTVDYVSPPSSIKGGSVFYGPVAMYKGVVNAPAGQVLTWVKGNLRIYGGCTLSPFNYTVLLANFASGDTWTRFGVRWWQGFDLLNQPATLVQEGTWNGSTWTWGATTYTTAMTGSENRIALMFVLGAVHHADDTEIWLPS